MDDHVYFAASGVVRWEEPHGTVVVEWEGWANTAEFAGLLDAEIAALKAHSGSRMLADCRRQRVLNGLSPEMVLRQRLDSAKQAIRIRYFASVDEAREWLGR